jgi:hypothetical protein
VTGESSVISRENVAVKRIRTEEEQEIANRKPSLIWKRTGGWTAASILLGIHNQKRKKKKNSTSYYATNYGL